MESMTDSPSVDVEGAARFANGLAEGSRIFRPRHEISTWVGAVVIGVALGIALVPLSNLALAPAFVHDLFSRGTYGTPTYEKSPINAYIFSAIVIVVARVGWRWLRQKPVEIVIDGEGITETEGGDVRVHIPWRDARALPQERHYRDKYGRRFVRQDVRFADPSGAMITVSNADDSLLFPDHLNLAVVRDREIDTLLQIARMLPPLDAKARDPRVVDERGATGLRIVTFLGTAIIVVVFYAALKHFGFGGDQANPYGVRSFPLPDALIMCAMLFVGGALRSIVPLRRFFRLRRLEREARATQASGEGGGAYRAAAKMPSAVVVPTKHERMRAYVALGSRVATVVLLVLFPFFARASVNETCRRQMQYGPADYCAR